MIDFETMFRKTKGLPFSEDGREYRAYIRLESGDHTRLRIRFVSGIESPRQGIRIDCAKDITFQKRRSRSLPFWRDSVPEEFLVQCAPHEEFNVRNLWDNGDGLEHSWHAGGAFWVETLGETLRLHANSTLLNDACEDLVVELTWA